MRMEIGVLVPLKMDIPRIPKFVFGWARISNYLSRVPKKYIHHDKYDGVCSSLSMNLPFFLKNVLIFYEINIKG